MEKAIAHSHASRAVINTRKRVGSLYEGFPFKTFANKRVKAYWPRGGMDKQSFTRPCLLTRHRT